MASCRSFLSREAMGSSMDGNGTEVDIIYIYIYIYICHDVHVIVIAVAIERYCRRCPCFSCFLSLFSSISYHSPSRHSQLDGFYLKILIIHSNEEYDALDMSNSSATFFSTTNNEETDGIRPNICIPLSVFYFASNNL